MGKGREECKRVEEEVGSEKTLLWPRATPDGDHASCRVRQRVFCHVAKLGLDGFFVFDS